LGILIGALGIGSAVPHGLSAIGALSTANWKWVVLACSVQAMAGALIVALWVKDGPYAAPLQAFDISQVTQIFRNRRLALANLGYFGHMWELYSWWAWIAVIFTRSSQMAGLGMKVELTAGAIEFASFAAMSMGGIGCVWAGIFSDRSSEDTGARIRQRSQTTIIAMAVSGSCCILTALFFHNIYVVLAIAFLWGLTISADSAQFSAIVSEVADAGYVGTALTLQTAIGFLLTIVSIRVTAYIGERFGWQWATASLAIGPLLGIAAMLRLRNSESLSASA
jgi:MFS family permease